MRASPTMRRRTFLVGATGLGASLAWRSLSPWAWPRRAPSTSVRLAGLPAPAESARLVGQEYLRAVPAEASPDVLVTRVLERLPDGGRTLAAASDRRLRELVVRATAEDFRHLRTVALRGWILAETEARLCALAELTGRSAAA